MIRGDVVTVAGNPVTVRRERIGNRISHLGTADVGRLNVAAPFVMGLAY